MSSLSFLKGKYKVSKAGAVPPSIQVEEQQPDVFHDRSRHKAKETLQNIVVRRSLSRATSQAASERGKSQESLPFMDAAASHNTGDLSRSGKIEDDQGGYLKPTDWAVGCIDRASAERVAVLTPTLHDMVQESGPQDQVMRTISGGASDKAKDRVNEAEGSVAIPNRPRNFHADETSALESRNKSPNIGVSSEQEITRIHMQNSGSQFPGAHNFKINGNPHFESNGVKNEYNYSNPGGTSDIPLLKEFVSFKAFYDSCAQDPTRRVHPETRKRVLKCILDWIGTPGAKERIFWLHGPAGVGKSAIAQTIARSCSQDQLAATFFFFRSDPSRSDGNRLFPTLAWKFAFAIPATKNIVIRSLNEHPDIPMRELEAQFEELIVKPFLALKISGIELPGPVVIIDGVDECSDDSLRRGFLKIIGNAVKDDRIPLRFLICSRPEAHIQDIINIFQSLTFPLDLAKLDDANQDIEKYLRVEFARIASEQELDPAWPGEEIIQEFVYNASGQFIYASTVIKYIDDEYSSAETQLAIIRGLKPASNISPFAELDELYKEILRRQRDPVFLKDFLSMLIGRLEIGGHELHEDDTLLMNVSEKELQRRLRGMHSILKFKPYIDVHHRSFLDFLQDLSRSCEYHITKQAGTKKYLNLIVDSLVRHASIAIEQHDDHFFPRFYLISRNYPLKLNLPAEEWQHALHPLLELQDKYLTLQNCRNFCEFLPCKNCIGPYTIRNLLLQLEFLIGFSSCVPNAALMAESHVERPEQIQNSLTLMDHIEIQIDVLAKDLDACLSSLLPRLRKRILGVSPDTVTIQLFCSLLHFDHIKTAMRLQSILEAQSLVNLVDELINNKYFCHDYSRKAALLALEISTRVPVIPSSVFLKGTVGPQHHVKQMRMSLIGGIEVLFQSMFMSKVLDPSHVVRVLWVYQNQNLIYSVADKMNENNESLRTWRKCSNPSLVIQIQIMLEVAKSIQYFHSMGVVLHSYRVDSHNIFLDSELHPRFWFLGVIERYSNAKDPFSLLSRLIHTREENVFFFGCLFYEMCFDTIIRGESSLDKKDALAKIATRPSKPEINDNVWQLIQHCCAEDPKDRLSMDAVVKEMEEWDIN